MSLVKVTGTNFIRDTASMAILPPDNTQKNDYLSRVRLVKAQKDEINSLKSEIDGMKTDVSEIKSLLKQLIGKE
jgi:hypothetical protein